MFVVPANSAMGGTAGIVDRLISGGIVLFNVLFICSAC